ncbi:MAG: phosphoribosylaminoimidazolecarboxamide formyltransferase [Spirochaetes bacterium]|nr:phosphoribosylaminoimidazolecarboxamide formyltransferase [Spirochaetota bacterium]
MKELKLRYGCNPHQAPARIFSEHELPITVLNGAPGYINLCDAFNAWQLVQELRQVTGIPAAASFKHVSPAGAALGLPITDPVLAKSLFVDDMKLTPVAAAYARARGADMMSSFGDFAAVSDTLDAATALILKREVSDGVIAPDFTPEAVEILKQKKGGKYTIIKIDPEYKPPVMEQREIYGITFEQRRNDLIAGKEHLATIVTKNKTLSEAMARDILLAMITVKYTQSNSVCYAYDGQIIGVGAGQQSRIHCNRLAAAKADKWFLRQHPSVIGMQFRQGISRAERNNAIDSYLETSLSPKEEEFWRANFAVVPAMLTEAEKRTWLDAKKGVALASDAFFPFRDNIDRASRSGVSAIIQPGGSLRDEDVIAACDEYGMTMMFSKVRLFHH